MVSRKTYCRALKLLQTQENLDAEARQILLTLLRDSIDDVCDYTSWWLSETDDFCVWTEDESQRWDLHKPEALYDFITGEYGRVEHIRVDSKRRKKLIQKRLAMGHKQDDHEQAQGYEQSL